MGGLDGYRGGGKRVSRNGRNEYEKRGRKKVKETTKVVNRKWQLKRNERKGEEQSEEYNSDNDRKQIATGPGVFK